MDHRKHVNMSKAANMQPGLSTMLADLTSWVQPCGVGVLVCVAIRAEVCGHDTLVPRVGHRHISKRHTDITAG